MLCRIAAGRLRCLSQLPPRCLRASRGSFQEAARRLLSDDPLKRWTLVLQAISQPQSAQAHHVEGLFQTTEHSFRVLILASAAQLWQSLLMIFSVQDFRLVFATATGSR